MCEKQRFTDMVFGDVIDLTLNLHFALIAQISVLKKATKGAHDAVILTGHAVEN